MAEPQDGEESPQPELLGPDEFRYDAIKAVYKGQYYLKPSGGENGDAEAGAGGAGDEQADEEGNKSKESKGDPVMHGEGEYSVGPERFIGTFKDGTFEHGVYLSRNGHRYEGQFKNNRYHGTGKYTWPDQRTYSGQWAEGKLRLCEGTFENFITIDEMQKRQAEKELDLGRQLLDKETKELWQNVDLKKNGRNIEFGRDTFKGYVVDNSFSSNVAKQEQIRKLLSDAATTEAQAE